MFQARNFHVTLSNQNTRQLTPGLGSAGGAPALAYVILPWATTQSHNVFQLKRNAIGPVNLLRFPLLSLYLTYPSCHHYLSRSPLLGTLTPGSCCREQSHLTWRVDSGGHRLSLFTSFIHVHVYFYYIYIGTSYAYVFLLKPLFW